MVSFSNESNGERNNFHSSKGILLSNRFAGHWMSPDATIFLTEDELLDKYRSTLKAMPKKQNEPLRGGLEKEAGDHGPLISDALKQSVMESDQSNVGAITRALGWIKDIGDID